MSVKRKVTFPARAAGHYGRPWPAAQLGRAPTRFPGRERGCAASRARASSPGSSPALTQDGAEALVGTQGLRLAARPVERHHELLPAALPQGLGRDRNLQLRDELGVLAERQPGREVALLRRAAHLCQPLCFGHADGFVGQIGKGAPSPERQGGSGVLGGPAQVTASMASLADRSSFSKR